MVSRRRVYKKSRSTWVSNTDGAASKRLENSLWQCRNNLSQWGFSKRNELKGRIEKQKVIVRRASDSNKGRNVEAAIRAERQLDALMEKDEMYWR